MNERINGLWWKARIGYNNQSCDPEVLEKFAELIVRECMTVCADNACRAGGANTQVGEDLYLAVDLIKKHFGVKE